MGAKSRRKGARAQRELAKRWRDSGLYPDAHSTQGRQVVTGPGKVPGDIEGVPFICEVKCGQPRLLSALRQAEQAGRDAGDARPPIAVGRYDGERWEHAVVVMRLTDFESMIEDSRGGWEVP